MQEHIDNHQNPLQPIGTPTVFTGLDWKTKRGIISAYWTDPTSGQVMGYVMLVNGKEEVRVNRKWEQIAE